MTDIEKKSPCDGCPGENLAGTCASITGLGRCNQVLRRKALEEYESLPKVHGWVARDKANDLYFFPHDCKPHRTDGIFCSEVSEDILHIDNSMFPEVNWQTEPIEVELLIRKI